jgi:SdpI/YfhL protein family
MGAATMANWIGVIVPAAMGVLFLAVGAPLMQRRVKRNVWYGVRFRSTVSDDAVWYPVNELGGRHLVVLGGCLVFVGLIGLVFTGNETTQRDLLILAVTITVAALAFSIRACWLLARDLARAQRTRRAASD